MEHILMHDWCSSESDINFIEEDDLDNSVMERIISNTFRDPMLSSDSEDEGATYKPKIDWNQVFKRTKNKRSDWSVFVPGFRSPPPYPKLSALSAQQHYQCLKVLCEKNPHILPTKLIRKPEKLDLKVFEDVKDIYLNEQKEYLEWAKSLWDNTHNVRALQPRPLTEKVYEAELKMRAKSLESFPKTFEMAAHISLANRSNKCEMTLLEDLIKVNVSDLPKVDISEPLTKKFSIFSWSPMPEPCNKHPSWFILPNEHQLSVLPLSEVHLALAQWAGERGAGALASERALLSLLSAGAWALPLSVCEVIAADGEKKNILVLGSDFSTSKQSAFIRTYKAFRHLLEYALLPSNEKAKLLYKQVESEAGPSGLGSAGSEPRDEQSEDESLDDEDWLGHLVINEGENNESKKTSEIEPAQDKKTGITNGHSEDVAAEDDGDKTTDKIQNNHLPAEDDGDKTTDKIQNNHLPAEDDGDKTTDKIQNNHLPAEDDGDKTTDKIQNNHLPAEDDGDKTTDKIQNNHLPAEDDGDKTTDKIQNNHLPAEDDGDKTTDKIQNNHLQEENTKKTFYTCSCSDSALGNPPPKSFRKWQIKNNTNNEKIDMVVHCSHKMKGPSGREVIVEPIVEYQIELGGTKQSPDTIRRLALSLLLRNKASLLNVRVDNSTGDIVTIDNLSLEDLTKEYNNVKEDISNVIYETFSQLQGLLPGHYILHHESTYGESAFLYASRVRGGGNKFCLDFDSTVLAGADEVESLKTPPLLTDVLLPIHKHRETLPCAFSPFKRQVQLPRAPQPARARPPPHVLKVCPNICRNSVGGLVGARSFPNLNLSKEEVSKDVQIVRERLERKENMLFPREICSGRSRGRKAS